MYILDFEDIIISMPDIVYKILGFISDNDYHPVQMTMGQDMQIAVNKSYAIDLQHALGVVTGKLT